MSNSLASILLKADDQTKAAFASVRSSLDALSLSTNQVSDKLKLLSGGFLSIKALAATSFGVAIVDNIKYLDSLDDISGKTGIAVNDLAGLGFAATQSGTDLDTLIKGIQKLGLELGKDPDLAKKLGIDAQDSVGKFKQAIDVLKGIEDENQRAALSAKLFGKTYFELNEVIEKGSSVLTENAEKGKALAGDLTDIAGEAGKVNDQIAKSDVIFKQFMTNLSNVAIPVTATVAGKFNNLINVIQGFKRAIFNSSSLDESVFNFVDSVKGYNELDSAQNKLVITTRKLADAEKDIRLIEQNRAILSNEDFAKFYDNQKKNIEIYKSDIDALNKKIATLKAPKALESKVPSVTDPKLVTGVLGQNTETDKAAEEARKKAELAMKRANDAMSRLRKAQADSELKIYQAQLDRERSMVEISFSNKQISFEDYSKKIEELGQRDYAKQLQNLKAALSEQRKLVNTASDEAGQIDARAEAARIQAEITQVEIQASVAATKANNDRVASVKEYNAELANLKAQIKEFSGDKVAALKIRIDLENDGSAIADTIEKKTLDALRIAKAGYDETLEQLNSASGSFDRRRENAQKDVNAGLITTIEYRQEINKINAQEAAGLGSLIPVLEKYNETLKDPALAEAIARLKDNQKELQKVKDDVAKSINDDFKSATKTLFNDFISGSKSAKQAFFDFADSINSKILDLIAQNFSEQLFKSISPGGAGGSGGGFDIGGFISKAFNFGGTSGTGDVAAAAASGASSGGFFDSIATFIGGLGFKAKGGPVGGGVPYIVGEKGPELIIPSSNGMVIPNNMMNGMGAKNNNVTINMNGMSGNMSQQSAQQQAAMVGMAVQRAIRRNG
jgi:hypothetical protein